MTDHFPERYPKRTNGLVDLIGRRATWGKKKVRIIGVALTDIGAVCNIVIVGRDKVHQIRIERLRLVPLESMPEGPEKDSR
jgi:hypothetical protein